MTMAIEIFRVHLHLTTLCGISLSMQCLLKFFLLFSSFMIID